MDYEKKYNEALEKARQLCAYPTTTPFISDLQDLFPELAESEDEKIRKAIVNAIHNYAYRLEEKIPTEWLTWLERQGEQKPEENKGNLGGNSPNWSEEDGMILSLIVNNLKFIRDTLSHDDKYTVDVGSFEGQIEWLQSLQDRVQPKQEWSEADEEMLNSTILFVEHSAFTTIGKGKNNVIYWLKSLRPQNKWKPSEEQMNNK